MVYNNLSISCIVSRGVSCVVCSDIACTVATAKDVVASFEGTLFKVEELLCTLVVPYSVDSLFCCWVFDVVER